MSDPTFLLASASPRRRQLLHEAGYSFDVQPSAAVEPDPVDFASPEAYAVHTAWLKANDSTLPSGCLILAADTVVASAGSILGKPRDRGHAEDILRSLMGTRHRVITGVCIAIPSRSVSLLDHVTSFVTMRRLADEELTRYLDSGAWHGKAGAYGIQDKDDPFVAACEGSFSNVVGLPMERLAELLQLADRIATGPPRP